MLSLFFLYILEDILFKSTKTNRERIYNQDRRMRERFILNFPSNPISRWPLSFQHTKLDLQVVNKRYVCVFYYYTTIQH